MRKAILIHTLIAILVISPAWGQSKYNGIPKEHHKYTPGDGVVEQEITFYSDDVACWGKIFYPKGFTNGGKTPAIILSHGWTGTHNSLLKYGNRFAEAGFVAMVIDYRGWGHSGGYVRLQENDGTRDQTRFTERRAKVQIKRTRLVPMDQVQDIRSAISYIQGEPGVDPNRIGLWGSSYAGGHVLTVASLDGRVSALVSQVPGINFRPDGPTTLAGKTLEDAIKRARSGQGAEFRTGFSTPRMVDVETQLLSRVPPHEPRTLDFGRRGRPVSTGGE